MALKLCCEISIPVNVVITSILTPYFCLLGEKVGHGFIVLAKTSLKHIEPVNNSHQEFRIHI